MERTGLYQSSIIDQNIAALRSEILDAMLDMIHFGEDSDSGNICIKFSTFFDLHTFFAIVGDSGENQELADRMRGIDKHNKINWKIFTDPCPFQKSAFISAPSICECFLWVVFPKRDYKYVYSKFKEENRKTKDKVKYNCDMKYCHIEKLRSIGEAKVF